MNILPSISHQYTLCKFFLKFKQQKLSGYLIFGICFLFIVVVPIKARSLDEIRKSKEIRVCVVPSHPSIISVKPTDCQEKCTYYGPVYEEVISFVKTLGTEIEPKFIKIGLDEHFHNENGKTVREASYTPDPLASGKCDFYPSNFTKNEWRLRKIDFVILFLSRMMIMVNKDKKAQIKKPADLAGKTAAVEKNTSLHTYLNKLNQEVYADNPIKIKLMKTLDALEQLDQGKIDFTLWDADGAFWSIKNTLKNSTLAFPIGPIDEIGWAFRKQDKKLQQAVQQFFDEQRSDKDSDFNKIWKHHFGTTLTYYSRLMSSTK